jgi:hypothetical protein
VKIVLAKKKIARYLTIRKIFLKTVLAFLPEDFVFFAFFAFFSVISYIISCRSVQCFQKIKI